MRNLTPRNIINHSIVSKTIPLFVRKATVKIPSFLSEYENRIKYLDEYIPSMNQIKIQWKSKIEYAQRAWNKVTKSELLEADGQKSKLVDMIQHRHATTRDEANKQVNQFFQKHML